MAPIPPGMTPAEPVSGFVPLQSLAEGIADAVAVVAFPQDHYSVTKCPGDTVVEDWPSAVSVTVGAELIVVVLPELLAVFPPDLPPAHPAIRAIRSRRNRRGFGLFLVMRFRASIAQK